MNEKIIQSYVFHEDQCFFVSTINRESSAGFIRYAETMVWEFDQETRERGKLIHQDEGGPLTTHFHVCENLHLYGTTEAAG